MSGMPNGRNADVYYIIMVIDEILEHLRDISKN